MSTNHLKMIVFISICGLGLLIFGFFGTRGLQTAVSTQTKTETRTETILSVSPRVFRKSLSPPQESLTDFQNTDFYRTIRDNNLFRPLGWTPPVPREPYRLIGTLIPTDGKSNAQALVRATATGNTHIVRIGDTLDKDTTVRDIASKQITLCKAGHQRTLKLNTTPLIK